MKDIVMLKMQGCPYCANALRALAELKQEDAYAALSVEEIDENLEAEKAKAFAGEYYYVPTFFVAGKKVYEAQPGDDYDTIHAAVRRVLDEARA